MTRGRDGSLLLSRTRLSLATPHRFDRRTTRRDSILGRYGGNATLLYLYRLLQIPAPIGDGLYLGLSIEAGNLWNDVDEASMSDLRYAGSLVVGVDTVFGPLYLAQGIAEHGHRAVYLFVGRSF